MEKIIKVKGLKKSYGGVTAVSDISFEVQKGQVFGLLGANGAGKSTTIECILGTKSLDAGEVAILGMDPIKHRKKLFQRAGVQFQEGSYQEKITVSELCETTHALYKSPEDYLELIETFKLKDKLQRQVKDLSGGERQRLFIVLALIPSPQVVFLDELTTGLDTKARRDLWKYISGLKSQGITIFLTSHYMDEVQILCDKVAILRKGTVVFYGTVSEAIASSPFENFEDAYLWYAGEE